MQMCTDSFIPETNKQYYLLLKNALPSVYTCVLHPCTDCSHAAMFQQAVQGILAEALQHDCGQYMDAERMYTLKAGHAHTKGTQDGDDWQTEQKGLLGYMTSVTAFLRPVSQHYIMQVYITASTAETFSCRCSCRTWLLASD